MTLGLRKAGLRVVCGVDIDPVAARTYRTSLKTPVLESDIRALNPGRLKKFIPEGSRVILAVCAPCQPFSKVRRTGGRGKDRDLLAAVGRLITDLRPAGVIVENVPQIGKGGKDGVLRAFCHALEVAGYSFAYRTLDAKDFGVPQRRRRMVLLGIKGINEDVELPSKNGRKKRTVREAIGGLPSVKAGEVAPYRPLHRAARLSKRNLERVQATPRNGGDSRAWPKSLRLPCHLKSGGFYDVYGRMRWDAPAPTLTTRCNSLSNGRFGHPAQNRAITLLEASILQTFPRSYQFKGNQNDIARQIGNAVPPKLAVALAKSLLQQL